MIEIISSQSFIWLDPYTSSYLYRETHLSPTPRVQTHLHNHQTQCHLPGEHKTTTLESTVEGWFQSFQESFRQIGSISGFVTESGMINKKVCSIHIPSIFVIYEATETVGKLRLLISTVMPWGCNYKHDILRFKLIDFRLVAIELLKQNSDWWNNTCNFFICRKTG